MRRRCRRAALPFVGRALILTLAALGGPVVALAAPATMAGAGATGASGGSPAAGTDRAPAAGVGGTPAAPGAAGTFPGTGATSDPSSSAPGGALPSQIAPGALPAAAGGDPQPQMAPGATAPLPSWPRRPPPRRPWEGVWQGTAEVATDSAYVPKRAVPRVPAGLFMAGVGLRSTRVSSDGYQPFSSNKAFAEADLDVAVRLFRDEKKAFYLGGAGGWGTTESTARGATAHLEAARLEARVQAAYAFRSYLMAVGRLSAGALWRDARLTGEALGTLEQTAWLPQGSAYLGLAARVAASRLDLLFSLEGGYAFVPNRHLRLASASTAVRETVTPIDLGDLSLGGPGVALRAALLF